MRVGGGLLIVFVLTQIYLEIFFFSLKTDKKLCFYWWGWLYFHFKVKVRRDEVDIQWERASEEVRSFYGKDYFYRFFQKDNREHSADSPDRVIQAVQDALLNGTPRARYLVPGSDRVVDIHAVG